MYNYKCAHCNKINKSKRFEKFCQHCGKQLPVKPFVDKTKPNKYGLTPQERLDRCIMPSLAEQMDMDFFEFMDKIKDEDFVKHLAEIGAI